MSLDDKEKMERIDAMMRDFIDMDAACYDPAVGPMHPFVRRVAALVTELAGTLRRAVAAGDPITAIDMIRATSLLAPIVARAAGLDFATSALALVGPENSALVRYADQGGFDDVTEELRQAYAAHADDRAEQ